MVIKSEIGFLEELENKLVVEELDIDTIIDILRDRIDELEPNKKHLWSR